MSESESRRALAPATIDMPVMSVEQAVNRYKQISDLVRRLLKEGIDYGKVPGSDRPTLFKAGGEKLTTFFGLRVTFEIIDSVQDWTGADHGGDPFFDFTYRCRLLRGGEVIAESDGSCNSMESKYRWRWVPEVDLPPGTDIAHMRSRGGVATEFAFAVEKADTTGKYGKPASYWQAFRDAIESGTAEPMDKPLRSGEMRRAWRIDMTVYRVPNDDIASQVNTLRKMAQKRAFIAATLLGVNASEFFTQDLEDIGESGDGDTIDGQVVRKTEAPKPTPAPRAAPAVDPATAFWTRAHEMKVPRERAEKYRDDAGGDLAQALKAMEADATQSQPPATERRKHGPDTTAKPEHTPPPVYPARPWEAETVQKVFADIVARKRAAHGKPADGKRSDSQHKRLMALLTEVGLNQDEERHAICGCLTAGRTRSTNDLTQAENIAWIELLEDAETRGLSEHAAAEMASCILGGRADQGQQTMTETERAAEDKLPY